MLDPISELMSTKLGQMSIVIFSVSVAAFVSYKIGLGVGTLIYRLIIGK